MCNDTDCACYDGAAYARIAKLELDSEHYEMLCQNKDARIAALEVQIAKWATVWDQQVVIASNVVKENDSLRATLANVLAAIEAQTGLLLEGEPPK